MTSTVLLRRHLPKLGNRWTRLSLRFRDQRFNILLSDRSELEVLTEVFLANEYELQLYPVPKVIFDLGSNIGISIVYFRARYPEARILGFEPDPGAYAKLVANTDGLENVAVWQVAIGAEEEIRTFWSSRDTWSSSLWKTRPWQEAIEVQAMPLEALMADLGVDSIDLLKIDIEGAEFEVLNGFSKLDRVRAIVGEFHPSAASKSPGDFFELLKGFDLQIRAAEGNYRFWGVRRVPHCVASHDGIVGALGSVTK